MASVHDAILFIAQKFPRKDDLANARLTKMIYLADWRAAIESGRQVTDIEWPFNHYGPFTSEVIDVAEASEDLEVIHSQTMYGSPRKVIIAKAGAGEPQLEPWEADALLHVLDTTSNLSWASFIELIYSTYPVVSQSRYTTLNLVSLADEYKKLKDDLPDPTVNA